MKLAQNLSKSLDWVKTTEASMKKQRYRKKIKNPTLYGKLTFQRKRKIAQIVLDDNIHVKILNFDYPPIRYTCTNKISYIDKVN